MINNHFIQQFIKQIRQLINCPDPLNEIKGYLNTLTCETLMKQVPFYDDLEVCLFEDKTVSIWYCRFIPGIKVPPHDHQMDVVVKIFDGTEHHGFYKNDNGKLIALKSTQVNAGEIVVLNGEQIHDVTPDKHKVSQALHVYFGPLNKIKRTVWDKENNKALPFTIENYQALAQ